MTPKYHTYEDANIEAVSRTSKGQLRFWIQNTGREHQLVSRGDKMGSF